MIHKKIVVGTIIILEDLITHQTIRCLIFHEILIVFIRWIRF